MDSPVITTPINLEATLNLDSGRMFVGVTAATGDNHWQVHDILSWSFQSLYIDRLYTPPLVVNGQGAFDCVNASVCVHPVNYDNFERTNNVWPPGADDTEPWQSGKEGYCNPCS